MPLTPVQVAGTQASDEPADPGPPVVHVDADQLSRILSSTVATARSGGLKPGLAGPATVQTSLDRQRRARTSVRREIRMDPVLRTVAVLSMLWVAAYSLAVYAFQDHPRAERILSNYVYLVPVALAAALSLLAARRNTLSVGRFWKLLALSNVGWLGGEVISASYYASGTQIPFPSVADAAYLFSYAVIPFAVVSAFRGRRLLVRGRAVLDVLAPTVVFAVAGWELLIQPQVSYGWSLVTLVGMAYPLGGVVIACLVISLGFTGRSFVPISISFVACGLGISAVTDAFYTHGVVLHSYVGEGWVNVGWQAEGVILCWAAVVALRHKEPDSEEAPLGSDRGLFPLMLAMAGALILVGVTVTKGILSKEAVGALLVAVTMVLVRMYLSAREMRDTAEALEQARAEQEHLAVTDVLTGLYNRRFVEELLRIETDRAKRSKAEVGLVILDIDHFKLVNDSYGHAAGDQVLAAVAERLRAALRPSDVLARYGGEEFLAVIPDGGPQAALEAAQRLCRSVADEPVAYGEEVVPVTVSAGVATISEWGSLDAMLRAADRALYAAKAAGRNRVHLASHEASPSSRADEVPAGLARIADAVGSRAGGRPHSLPMAAWAGVLAERLGLDNRARRVAVIAARLHDIGKMALPDSLLARSGPLAGDERRLMEGHSAEGARMLAGVPDLVGVAEAVRSHHERYDGAGYPDGLTGGEIPQAARIVSVCEAWATMLAPTFAAPGASRQDSRDALERGSGTAFDPAMVEAFLALETAGLVGSLPELGSAPVPAGSGAL